MNKLAKSAVRTIATFALPIFATATVSRAGQPAVVPEIDPTTGLTAIALVAGAVLVIRGRCKN